MFRAIRQLFSDLTGPPRPCDVCQLGEPMALAAPRASYDWRFDDHGLKAEFFLCSGCRSQINAAGLQHKLPFVGVAWLLARDKIRRPPARAFLQHQVWRSVWEHTRRLLNEQPMNEEDQIAVLDDALDKMIAGFR